MPGSSPQCRPEDHLHFVLPESSPHRIGSQGITDVRSKRAMRGDLSCPFEEVGIVIAGRALWLVVGCFLPLECSPAGRTKNPDRCMRSGTLLIAALLIFSLPEGSRGAEVIPLMDRCLTLSLFSCCRGQGGSGGIRHLP